MSPNNRIDSDSFSTFGPMLFEDVIGQEEVKKHLIQTVEEGRISHAQLFVGPEGSGTLPLAIAYARYVINHASPDVDAANLKVDKLVHPDLHFCYPVNTTTRVKSKPVSANFIAEWRQAILENPYTNLFQWLNHLGIENKQGLINVEQSMEILKTLSLKAFESEFKIMIIWMAEKMNNQTANKLLKIIEEPPEKTLFILVAENYDMILPTILSRTQLVKVPPIKKDDLKQALISKHGLPEETAASVAHLSSGNYLEALRLIKSSDQENFNQAQFIAWMRLCFSKKYFEILDWVEVMAKSGREKQKNFLSYGLHIFRESLMKNFGGEELVRLEGTEKGFVEKFAPFVNQANCLQMVELFEKSIYHIERNANPKILFLDVSLKMLKLLRVKPN